MQKITNIRAIRSAMPQEEETISVAVLDELVCYAKDKDNLDAIRLAVARHQARKTRMLNEQRPKALPIAPTSETVEAPARPGRKPGHSPAVLENIRRIQTMRQDGMADTEISRRLGKSNTYAYSLAGKRPDGCSSARHTITQEKIDRMRALREAGHNNVSIQKLVGCSYASIRKHLGTMTPEQRFVRQSVGGQIGGRISSPVSNTRFCQERIAQYGPMLHNMKEKGMSNKEIGQVVRLSDATVAKYLRESAEMSKN